MTILTDAKKAKSLLSFGMMLAGMILLCNPNLNLFDIMPDAIGYGLLLLAVRASADIFPHFDEAERAFRTLMWINIAKIPGIYLMMTVTGINMNERGMITVFALGFAVVEWIFAIPGFRALFEGLTYIGEREGVFSAISVKGSEKKYDSLISLTTVFLIVKGACSFLPETVFLSTFFYNGSLDPRAVNPTAFYPLLAILAFLITLVFGLIWIISLAPYLQGMRKDDEMTALLAKKGESLAERISLAKEQRRTRLFFLLFLVGFVFAIDLPISGSDYLPDYMGAVALVLSFFLIENKTLALRGKILGALYAVASIARAILSMQFFERFSYVDVAFRDAALAKYMPVLIATLAEGILFFLTILSLLLYLKDFILANTGKSLRAKDTVIRNEVHTYLKKKNLRLGIIALVYAVLRPVTAYLLTIAESHTITKEEANQYYSVGSRVVTSKYAWLWILVLAVGIFMAAYAYFHTRAIKLEADMLSEDEE